MWRVLAIGALLLAVTGCGTVQNFRRESFTDATPYGGVKIPAKELQGDDFVAIAFMWPFWTADVVLSAVGDTLTLPVTVPLTAWRVGQAIRTYYHAEDESAAVPNEWRRFWYDDAPEPREPRVPGGIY